MAGGFLSPQFWLGLSARSGAISGTGSLVDTAPVLIGAGYLTHYGVGALVDTIPTIYGTGGNPEDITIVLRSRSTIRGYSSRPRQTNSRR